MVATLELAGLLVILLVNTAAAALLTRFLRVRLKTRWGSAIYTALAVPVVLLALTLVLGSIAGPNLGSPTAVVGVAIIVPAAIGIAFDYFWMPAPDDVDLPEGRTDSRPRQN